MTTINANTEFAVHVAPSWNTSTVFAVTIVRNGEVLTLYMVGEKRTSMVVTEALVNRNLDAKELQRKVLDLAVEIAGIPV